VGLATGWLRGGRLGRLAEVRVVALPLLLAGPVLQATLPLLWPHLARSADLELARAGLLYASAIGFLAFNLRLPGALPALVGASANAAATLWAGGRMPVWAVALRHFPPAAVRALTGGLGAHALMAHPSGVGWLGDVLWVPVPVPDEVISVGDVLIAGGLALFLATALGRR